MLFLKSVEFSTFVRFKGSVLDYREADRPSWVYVSIGGLQTLKLSVVSLNIDLKGLNPKGRVIGQLVVIVDC